MVPNASAFSYLVTFGGILVGIALILGLFTGIAAYFGAFMIASFIFAGVAGANPLMFILATWLVLAWRVAGYWGLGRWCFPPRRPRLTGTHVSFHRGRGFIHRLRITGMMGEIGVQLGSVQAYG